MAKKPCPVCHGAKVVTERANGRWVQVKCWFCDGKGEVDS